MPAILEGGGGPGVAGIPTDLDTRFYGKVSGVYKRKAIPPITSLDFELIERGGMGSGSFSFPCAWEDLSLDGTEFIDVRLFGQADPIIYRGFVQIPTPIVESVEMHNAELQSIIGYTKYMVRWPYAYGGGADLAVVANDLLTDFVSGPSDRLGAYLTTDLQTTGITVTEFDATGRSVWQAFNMLCDKAPGLVIWGVEAGWSAGPPGTPQHRIYLRPRPDVTGKYYSIGGNITGFTYPKDVGSIVNVMDFVGGSIEQPNLCYNGSFEEVAPAGELVANLLADYSFEDNDAAWTLTGSRKYTGMDGTAMGSPKSGKTWLELDQNTESGIQVVLASFNAIYIGSCWVRRETIGTATQVKLTIEGLDNTNAVIVTSATAYAAPAGTNWEKITTPDLDCTGQPTVTKIRFRVETNGGSASNDGVLVDDTALIVKESEGAVGWKRRVVGLANASSFEWNYRPATGSFHKGYAVRVTPSAIATSADYIEIRTDKLHRIDVRPNERLSLLLYTNGASGASDFSFGITEFTSADAETTTSESATQAGGNNAWLRSSPLEINAGTDGPGITTRADTAKVEVFVRFRENQVNMVDGIFLCHGELPPTILDMTDYWAGENYERIIKTSDALFTGGLALDADADSSIADYGEREEEVSNELVTDYSSFMIFAQDFFNSAAVPSIMANLRVERLMRVSELLTTADDKVRIINLPNAPDALNPVRVSYTIRGDAIDFTADLGNEMPTMDALLRYVQGRTKVRGF